MLLSKDTLTRLTLAVGLLALGNQACTEGFPPFNEIDRLRVLAISSEPPWLVRTSTDAPVVVADLSALVVNAATATTTPLAYRWSWCPLRAGSVGGGEGVGAYECSVTQELLMQQGGGDVPEGIFELGEGRTAELPYVLDPKFIADICDQLSMSELPAFVGLPKCDGKFPISVQLEVCEGISVDRCAPSNVVRALKDVMFVYPQTGEAKAVTEARTNANPTLGDNIWAIDPANPATKIPLAEDGTTELLRDVNYTLEVEIDPALSEPTTVTSGTEVFPAFESQTLTWFIESGEADSTRTRYAPTICSRDPDTKVASCTDCTGTTCDERVTKASMQQWLTPKAIDFEPNRARVFVVIRDDRQGASWIQRSVRLVEAAAGMSQE